MCNPPGKAGLGTNPHSGDRYRATGFARPASVSIEHPDGISRCSYFDEPALLGAGGHRGTSVDRCSRQPSGQGTPQSTESSRSLVCPDGGSRTLSRLDEPIDPSFQRRAAPPAPLCPPPFSPPPASCFV